YRGQRGRVQRLLEVSGIGAPRYGPRMAPQPIAEICGAVGAPGRIQPCAPLLRRQPLWSTELRGPGPPVSLPTRDGRDELGVRWCVRPLGGFRSSVAIYVARGRLFDLGECSLGVRIGDLDER